MKSGVSTGDILKIIAQIMLASAFFVLVLVFNGRLQMSDAVNYIYQLADTVAFQWISSNWVPIFLLIVGFFLLGGLTRSIWRGFARYRQRYSIRASWGLSLLKLMVTLLVVICYCFVFVLLGKLFGDSFSTFFMENSYASLASIILLGVTTYEARRWFDRRVLSTKHNELEVTGVVQ